MFNKKSTTKNKRHLFGLREVVMDVRAFWTKLQGRELKMYLQTCPRDLNGGWNRMNRRKADRPLTLHDLLQLHLQGLDSAGWIVSGRAFYPVDRQPAVHHCSHIIVLQEDHTVCVLNHCAVVTRQMDQKQQLLDLHDTATAEICTACLNVVKKVNEEAQASAYLASEAK